ncbi:MAG: peptidyl-prolyl cis-trans isomerase [Planctomycetes bacterium]|nr:peptidyl-prolyl cis-trans isomerase [Planctomycetota bacterium]
MRSLRLALVLLLPLGATQALLPLRAAQAQEQTEKGDTRPGGVVALVDGVPITRYELDLACRLEPNFRDLTVGSTLWRKAMAQQLDVLIEQRLILHKARSEKIELTASDERFLTAELNRRAQSVGGIAAYRAQIEEQLGVPYDYFVARQKASLLRQKLMSKSVSQDIFVSPAEIRRFYVRNRSRYERRGEIRLRQIVIYPDVKEALRKPPGLEGWLKAGNDWDAGAYAAAVRKRIVDGERFAVVAKDCSLGPKWGEEIKVSSSQSLDEYFIRPLGERIEAMRPGEISKVITTVRASLYLLELVDRREPGPLPLSEVQTDIERELKIAIRKQRELVWLRKLRREATVQVYFKGIAK